MTHVSYKGDGPMLQDLLVGRLSFGGLLVPAATPADVVAVLQAGCEKAMLSPGYREWAQKANQVVDFKPSSGFESRLRQDSQSKAATLKRLGLCEPTHEEPTPHGRYPELFPPNVAWRNAASARPHAAGQSN